jgi:hypothetical protein
LLVAACSSSSKSSSGAGSATTTTAAPTPTTIGTPLAQAKAQTLMLKASDIGHGFTDGTWSAGAPGSPEPCGQPGVDAIIPPTYNTGSELDNGGLVINENYTQYADSITANNAWNLDVQGFTCSQGALSDSGTTIPLTISTPTDVTAQVGDLQAIEINVKSSQFTGVVIGVKLPTATVAFEFLAQTGADTSQAPDAVASAKQGVAKITAG